MLPPVVRENALADTARVLEENSGGIHMVLFTDPVLGAGERTQARLSTFAHPGWCLASLRSAHEAE
jgi:hypothetical protein